MNAKPPQMLAGVMVLIGVAGCSDAGGTSSLSSPTPPSISSVSTSEPAQVASETVTVTVTQTADATEFPSIEGSDGPTSTESVALWDCGLSPPTAPLLQRSWGRLVRSQGSSDHERYVNEFVENVDDIMDRMDDDLPQELLGPCGTVEIALLARDAAFLEAMVLVGGAANQHYADAAQAGNDWLEAIGASGVERFVAP